MNLLTYKNNQQLTMYLNTNAQLTLTTPTKQKKCREIPR